MDSSNMKINSDNGSNLRSTKIGSHRETKKDFKKILGKDRREDQQRKDNKEVGKEDKDVEDKNSFREIADNAEAQEAGPTKKGVSLFDLAAIGKEEDIQEEPLISQEEDLPISKLSQDVLDGSLSALFQGYGSKEKLKSLQLEVQSQIGIQPSPLDFKSDVSTIELSSLSGSTVGGRSPHSPMEDLTAESSFASTKLDLPKEKGSATSKFAHEQQEIAAIAPINPQQNIESLSVSNVEQAPQQTTIAEMKELVDQIISKLYTVDTSEKTQTIVQLKHPPLFAGSNVIITSFKSAKGEFNISFENLNQGAKALLDRKENQNALKFALDQKGFTVHIVTATTLSETPFVFKSETAQREQREREDQGSSSEKEEKKEKRNRS